MNNKKTNEKIIQALAHGYSILAAVWFITAVHFQPVWFLTKILFTFLFISYVYYNYQLFKNREKKK